MTKRECEVWFGQIADTLDPTKGFGSPQTHARIIANCARKLLAEEREQRERRQILEEAELRRELAAP